MKPIRFCPYCGTPTLNQPHTGKVRPSCPGCGWVYFPDPKVGVAVLVIQSDEILLVRRRYEPYAGMWALPAGFLDAHEDPQDAARRECLEETGLIVKIRSLITVLSGREHPRGADLMLAYCAEVVGGSLAPGDDADRASFFPLENLPPLAFHTTLQAVQQWKEMYPCIE